MLLRPWPLRLVCSLAWTVLAACSADPQPTDPGPGTWRTAAPAPQARLEGFAAALDGKIYLLGGITGTLGDQSTAKTSVRVDIYDPKTNSWTDGPALPASAARHHLAVATVVGKAGGADALYLVGGFTGILGGTEEAGQFVPNAQTWRLAGGKWTRLADQPLARGAATAQAIGGIVYVAGGGLDENGALTDLFAYDPSADKWSPRAPMPTPREHLASCAVAGQLLVVGGWAGTAKQTVTSAETYDAAKDKWTVAPDLAVSRGGLAAAAVGNVCYVVGGERWDVPLPATFADNEGLAPSDKAWRTLAPMPTARHGLGLVALAGELYAIAGAPIQGNSYTSVVEVFRP